MKGKGHSVAKMHFDSRGIAMSLRPSVGGAENAGVKNAGVDKV